MIGKTIAHYKVLEKLGEGGMGAVYKAEDTRLNRLVALKFLSAPAADGANLESRFLHEARAAAALDHPNICGVYEINVDEGRLYMAMPLIDGEGLDKRIEAGPRPLEEALTIAIQTAEALEEAHAKQIVHRDIKPSNILLVERERGRLQVKLLDFGLARLSQATKLTREGATLGTAAYMSPEQAEGRTVDHRTDVWSLGVMLYEVVSGRLPFPAEYEQALFYAILNEDSEPLTAIRSGVPMELERIVNKCLSKSADERYQSMADLLVDLNALSGAMTRSKADGASKPGSTTRVEPAAAVVPAARATSPWAWLAAGSVLGAIAMWALWAGGAAQTGRIEYELHRVTWDGQLNAFPALSPDGTLLAFSSDRSGRGDLDIWVKQVNGGSLVQVTDDPEDETLPSFSADGSQLLYHRAGEGVYTVPTLGGEPYLIAAGASNPAFSPDSKQVAYLKSGSIYVSPVSMGEPELLLGDLRSSGQLLWTPDGRHVLFAGRMAEGDFDWFAVPVDGSEVRSLGARELYSAIEREPPVGMSWTWAGDSLIFENGNAELARIGFDFNSLRVRGSEELLTVGAGLEISPTSARDGVIAFMNAWQRRDIWSIPLDGSEGPRRLTTAESFDASGDVSASGRRLVYISNRWNEQDIWTVSTATGQELNLTKDDAEQLNPILDRDGQRVAYLTRREGKSSIYVRPYGGGFGGLVCEDCGAPTDWSPDGAKILFNREDPGTVAELDVDSGEASELLVAEGCRAGLARYSPDGTAVVFDLDCDGETGGIYIARLVGDRPPPRESWIEVTADLHDSHPVWGPNADRIYFASRHLGSLDIWYKGLDPDTLETIQELEVVHRFPHARYSMDLVRYPERRLSIGGGRLFFSLSEAGGAIWMMEPVSNAAE